MKERILTLINSLNVSIAQFERSLNWGTAYVHKIKNDLPKHKITEIVEKYPQVNREWLESGEGEMFLPASTPIIIGDGGNYQKVDGNNNNVIGNHSTPYNISESEKHTKHVIGCKEGRIIEVDLATIKNLSLEEFSLGNELRPLDPADLIPECTFMYTLCSNELWPYLSQGDRIFIKKISVQDVIHGEIYLVDTKSDGKMIKRVEIDSEGNYMMILPIDVPGYPVVTLPLSQINDFYALVCRIQNQPTVQFSHPLYIKEVMKQNSDLVKFAQQAIESNNLMHHNVEKTLSNQEATLTLLSDAMKVIARMQEKMEGENLEE